MPVDFPQRQVAPLQELAARLFESRKTGLPLDQLARDLMRGFYDVCAYAGLDNVLDALEVTERTSLEEREGLFAALVAQLVAIELDGGGPRNAKPTQMAACVVKAFDLNVIEVPGDTLSLTDDVRTAMTAAIDAVVKTELAIPAVREAIIAEARTRCDASYESTFNKITAQLDDRGTQLMKQPKVPIDASHAVQRALTEARTAVIARVAAAVRDRVAEALPAEAAARLDQPITVRSTPREVAIKRAIAPRVGMVQAKVVQSLTESVTELARLGWHAPEQTVIPYGASKTFEVGDVVEHVKFGRGTVKSRLASRVDVEFADGVVTLVHVPPGGPARASAAPPPRRPAPARPVASEDEPS
ncbi:hypothetical protein BH11MYX1_BH11MYX1_24140 [soil metagenome]